MLTRRHTLRKHSLAAVVAAIAVLPFAVTAQAANSVEFTTNSSMRAPATVPDYSAPAEPRGVTEKRLVFRLTKQDTKALAKFHRSLSFEQRSEAARERANQATERLSVVDEIIAAAEVDESSIKTTVAEGNTSFAFLRSGDGISDLTRHAETKSAELKRARQSAKGSALTLDRMYQLRDALEVLRDGESEAALQLSDRAAMLDVALIEAEDAHFEADAKKPIAKNAGLAGDWYVTGGAFGMPMLAKFDGDAGARTPRRRATPDQITRVLTDERLKFDDSGISDISRGAVDGRVLDALTVLAQQFGYVNITSLKSDHPSMTTSGGISMHSYGCAVDIGTIGSTYINGASQMPGGQVDQAVRMLASLPGDLAPHQVISLFDFGGATMAMGDHADHIHLGYSC